MPLTRGRREGSAPEMGGPRARRKLRAPYSNIAKNLGQGQQSISQGPSVGVCGGVPLSTEGTTAVRFC